MNDLIQLLWTYLTSDDAPELYTEDGEPFDSQHALALAQDLAEQIVAQGWPKS